jgi:dihydroneopterin aldolase
MEVCLEFHIKFGIHGILGQNVTNHQILMRISIVSTNRHRCQYTVVDLKLFCDKKLNIAAAKPEVVSYLEISSVTEKFRRVLPILLDIYVAETIAEHLMHESNCEIQNG